MFTSTVATVISIQSHQQEIGTTIPSSVSCFHFGANELYEIAPPYYLWLPQWQRVCCIMTFLCGACHSSVYNTHCVSLLKCVERRTDNLQCVWTWKDPQKHASKACPSEWHNWKVVGHGMYGVVWGLLSLATSPWRECWGLSPSSPS